jgi:hypothetical protein
MCPVRRMGGGRREDQPARAAFSPLSCSGPPVAGSSVPDHPVRQVVYPAVAGGEQTLREPVHEC